MSTKRMYIQVIICGVLLVLASLFIMLATRTLNKSDIVQTKAIVFIIIGVSLFMSGMIFLFYTTYKILKDKGII